MLVSSTFIALGLSALAVLMLAGAIWQSTRVLGRISAAERDLLRYQTAVEQLDIRITREVKARAGLARAADVADERSVLEQAQATLAEADPSVTLLRPKRTFRR